MRPCVVMLCHMIDCPPTDYFIPSKIEEVSASRYLEMVNGSEKDNIKHVHFQPPTIGGKGFGSFVVEYNAPKLIRKHA